MSGRILHCVLDIQGVLDWPSARLVGLFRHSDGRVATAEEARAQLRDLLAEGKAMLPLGGPCDGFSYKTGCPGHAYPMPENWP